MLRAVVLLVCLLASSVAQAEKRVALVIGNSAYRSTAPLTNPLNDAADMVAALKRRGFQVIDGFDLDKASFDRKVRDFAAALPGAEVGLFFYAGHGLQVALLRKDEVPFSWSASDKPWASHGPAKAIVASTP